MNVTPRDKRKNFEESRFRLLCVKKDFHQATHHKAILQAARESGWIGEEFETLLSKGSGVVIGLILQTPKDHMPFMSLSMKELGEDGKNIGLDWVCLLYAPSIDLSSLLNSVSVPQDFKPLPVDFMFLLVQILSIQAEKVRDEVTRLMESLTDIEGIQNLLATESLGDAKNRLFKCEKTHLQLQNRSRFVQELADNITKCFDVITKRHNEKKTQNVQYSSSLKQRVRAQLILCKMMQPDLDAISAKIQARHRMIDTMFNTMMAEISYSSVEQARRDSSSMKAIAAVTLVFLPATFIAAIFSMSMFNWLAGQTEGAVSHRLWIFFIISVPLTVAVLLIWRIMYKRGQREYEKTRDEFRGRWHV
ncbi:hypothetical protein F4805DRAFT_478076 [Annulohypoxylon moriforme]|nr:hypothetical protein F4805DRAFT_478076 [Annulohypoxylon moriforme]